MAAAEHICVMEIGTQNPVYEGTSYGAAALALEPGTTYGKGATKAEAAEAAVEACQQAAMAGWCGDV